jgi:hypothetical protein
MTIPFWLNEPTILFNKNYVFELWPTPYMCYEQKLNAITRLILLITILGYVLTNSIRILVVGILTLGLILILFTSKKKNLTKNMIDEGFEVKGDKVIGLYENTDANTITNPVTLEKVLKTEFKEGNKLNPFSNVLLTQIMDDPERKSAPPAFNPDVEVDITKSVKKAVQFMNPGIKNTDKQLYSSIWDEFELTQSNRAFYSTPNTRVENDQSAFAQFLYNDLKYSGKESTPEGAITRVKDSYRYTLY